MLILTSSIRCIRDGPLTSAALLVVRTISRASASYPAFVVTTQAGLTEHCLHDLAPLVTTGTHAAGGGMALIFVDGYWPGGTGQQPARRQLLDQDGAERVDRCCLLFLAIAAALIRIIQGRRPI